MIGMFSNLSISLREVLHAAAAVLLCGGVLYLDVRTSADITEAFLLPLAFLAVYPIKRDWATYLVAAAAIATVIGAALLEDEGELLEAMLVNRGMTIVVVIGIAFLLHRVTRSELQLVRIATTDALTGIFNRRHFMSMLYR